MVRVLVTILLLCTLWDPSSAGGAISMVTKPGQRMAPSATSSPIAQKVIKTFVEKFGEQPKHVFSAPGRVNLIGEHTDYNDGFVMPCAIDFRVYAACTPINQPEVVAVAADLGGKENIISLSTPIKQAPSDAFWSNYIRGVAKVLSEDKQMKLEGVKMVVGGDVPQGAGLSSSAALEVATGTMFNSLNGLKLGPKEIALIGQSAEHWVGCNCGIMDQLISSCGKKGHALLIDCRDLSTTEVKIPAGTAVVIVNSNFKHALAGLDSEYNQRRAQCEAAARHFGVTALRDVTVDQIIKAEKELDEKTFRRARHVVTENDRTVAASKALKKGDLKEMGRLMAASHISMRDDFEITVPAIDALVDIINGVIKGNGGVRMTGGGFGGSVVCLTPEDKVEEIRAAVAKEYPLLSGGLQATVYVCHASQGAGKCAK